MPSCMLAICDPSACTEPDYPEGNPIACGKPTGPKNPPVEPYQFPPSYVQYWIGGYST